MKNIILALILRELKTRFGKNPTLGYVWVIGEPMLHILIILVFISYVRGQVLPQLPYSLFLIMGMVPFFMFRNIATNIMNGIEANRSLFVYKPVKPIHVFLARAILEGMIYFLIFITLMIIFSFLLNYSVIPDNFLMVLCMFILMIIYAFTLGIIFAIVSFFMPMSKIIFSILLQVMYFISAVIYPLWIVPIKYAKYIALNPLVHIMECLKENYFYEYPIVNFIDINYGLKSLLVILIISLAAYYHFRVQISVSQ